MFTIIGQVLFWVGKYMVSLVLVSLLLDIDMIISVLLLLLNQLTRKVAI